MSIESSVAASGKPEEPANVMMSKTVVRYRYLALVSHVLLLAWMSIWYLALDTKADYSITFILLFYILPLLLPLKGIIQAKPYTHAWACFIVLLYFLHAITVIYAEPVYLFHAGAELVLASAMFVGCMMFARLRGQELGTNLEKLSKVMEDEKNRFEGRGQ
ncbi:DUF2069 domain-containing protein [Glaciecola siphonariae]|uniref:DUF2069 domain-containing protein n=1 Tax=Glaciecola siphonariae TaxID=521012 RepID=A0ABV9LS28_9ALTE